MSPKLQTNVSQAFWCSMAGHVAELNEAQVTMTKNQPAVGYP